jgi:hypothetical protein
VQSILLFSYALIGLGTMLLVLSFISAGKEHHSGKKLNGLFFLALAVVGLCLLVALVATYISTGGLTLK